MGRNVLFITMDQWRGDCLSALGHPIVSTPALDRLASAGVLFSNHWANAAPCGPSRACLYTGTYLFHNRSVANGTPLDARFTNIALLARAMGYDPVLFGYTDTSVDPATVAPDDPRLRSYEEVLPGFRAIVHDPFEKGSPAWGRWLASKGVDVPANPHDLYLPIEGFPDAQSHGSTWAPARFGPEHSQSAFITESVIDYLNHHADECFFVHASYIRPHPPRRNPIGYHDLYDADALPDFVGHANFESEATAHPLNNVAMRLPVVGAPQDERERRQMRATYYGAQREVDEQLARLFGYLAESGLDRDTLVVVTSDHGEMGGDHWLFEKLGYWDESFHVPLIIVDPRMTSTAGSVIDAFTEAVDLLPTLCEWIGSPLPLQADGFSLYPMIKSGIAPEHWRQSAHFEWDFRNWRSRIGGVFGALPLDHCSLIVQRGKDFKYVQFGADPRILPPLLFDLRGDPQQLHNLWFDAASTDLALREVQEMLQWRMRFNERGYSSYLLTAAEGLVIGSDEWR